MGSRLMLGSGSAPLLNRLFHCIPMERRANTCEKPSPHRNTSSSVIGKWCALRAMSIFFLVVLGCLFYFFKLWFWGWNPELCIMWASCNPALPGFLGTSFIFYFINVFYFYMCLPNVFSATYSSNIFLLLFFWIVICGDNL